MPIGACVAASRTPDGHLWCRGSLCRKLGGHRLDLRVDSPCFVVSRGPDADQSGVGRAAGQDGWRDFSPAQQVPIGAGATCDL
jgi:hypothetical protein